VGTLLEVVGTTILAAGGIAALIDYGIAPGVVEIYFVIPIGINCRNSRINCRNS